MWSSVQVSFPTCWLWSDNVSLVSTCCSDPNSGCLDVTVCCWTGTFWRDRLDCLDCLDRLDHLDQSSSSSLLPPPLPPSLSLSPPSLNNGSFHCFSESFAIQAECKATKKERQEDVAGRCSASRSSLENCCNFSPALKMTNFGSRWLSRSGKVLCR